MKTTNSSQRFHTQAAKRKCLERIEAMRAQTAAEQEARSRAAWEVRQMRNRQQASYTSHSSLNPGIFESALRSGLEDYFATHPEAKECFLTTDQVLMLAHQPEIWVDVQLEIFRRATIAKFLGCVMVAWDSWRFPRIERATPTPVSPTSTLRTSIFDK